MNKIYVTNLTFFYGNTPAIKNVTLTVKSNTVLALIGPSGCGKTTLLKCMNRLTDLYPELKVSGKIMIDNKNILESQK